MWYYLGVGKTKRGERVTKHMTCGCSNCHESKLNASQERKKYFKREANRALRRVINHTAAWENPLDVVRGRDLWA
jgi:uncharacterized pyridoxal phosphate-containing UPF0001 family protein